jgi:DNA-binding transcriptional MerR regulator
MRIAELARRTEIPVATIKFYLREGLMPEGERTSPTQAQYGEEHVARLRLVRALVGPGGLSIAKARSVIEAIEHPPALVHDLLGVAADAVSRPVDPDGDHAVAHELMHRWGWQVVEKDCASHAALAEALAAIQAAGFTLPDGALELYREHMFDIAAIEIANVPTESAAAAVRYVVLGTVLVEPLLLALRRLAQQEISGRRFGAADVAGDNGA